MTSATSSSSAKILITSIALILVLGGYPQTGLSQTFAPTGSMGTPRSGHTATLLSDGSVLVVGGAFVSGYTLNTAELYDPITGAWRSTSHAMNFPREAHAAVLLEDGRVLIVGGGDSTDPANPNVGPTEIFDPATETFQVVGSLQRARRVVTATRLADGRVIAVGGYDGPYGCFGCTTSVVEIFDPALNQWSLAAPLPLGRVRSTVTILTDGRVLVAGGEVNAALYSPNVMLYDPVADTWTTMAPMLIGRSTHHSAHVLFNGRVLFAGGTAYSTPAVEIYDPAAAPIGTSVLGPEVGVGAWSHGAATLPDGTVLLVGGATPPGSSPGTITDSAQIVDPVSLSVLDISPLTAPREFSPESKGTLLPSGRVLLCGGWSGTQVLATAELWLRSPLQATEYLLEQVLALNLPQGQESRLEGMLQPVLNTLDDLNTSNDGAAVKALDRFKSSVRNEEALGTISPEDADRLVALADLILALLE